MHRRHGGEVRALGEPHPRRQRRQSRTPHYDNTVRDFISPADRLDRSAAVISGQALSCRSTQLPGGHLSWSCECSTSSRRLSACWVGVPGFCSVLLWAPVFGSSLAGWVSVVVDIVIFLP